MQKNAGFILLIIAGMFLLMLAISGRFHDIFTAAFPSLKGGSSGDSGSADNTPSPGTTATPPSSGGPGEGINNPSGSNVPRSGAQLIPLPTGGYTYGSLYG